MTSKTINITSTAQFDDLLKNWKTVVVDFYAEWCGPCKVLSPKYEELSQVISRPSGNQIVFTKVDTDAQKELAARYSIRSIPTFMICKDGKEVRKVGANPKELQEVIMSLAKEASEASTSGGSGGSWRAGNLPKGYSDLSDQVEIKGLELLNADNEFGSVRVLFEQAAPTGLQKGKSTADKKDWVETDTDEQLMMYMPFQAMLKIHTLQITSLPPTSEDDDEVPMRPKTINLYTNRPHILGFEEADDIPATQSFTLEAKDWDPATGTATIPLRFVKFQNVTSLVLFVVDGDGSGDRVRVDRIRLIGETGEKRDGKVEKIEHDH